MAKKMVKRAAKKAVRKAPAKKGPVVRAIAPEVPHYRSWRDSRGNAPKFGGAIGKGADEVVIGRYMRSRDAWPIGVRDPNAGYNAPVKTVAYLDAVGLSLLRNDSRKAVESIAPGYRPGVKGQIGMVGDGF